MGRLTRYRRWIVAFLLLPLLTGCSGSSGTSTGSEPAGSEAATTAESTAGAAASCVRTPPETIGRILNFTPAGPPESLDGDPLVLLGAPRGLLSFTGCGFPLKGPQVDADSKLEVDVFVAAGGHDDFERIRGAAKVKLTPVPGLGDEAFTAMTLQTLVIARKGAQIVVVGYLVQNEENTIKVAREVLATL
jgi:hypothetical protein